MTFLLATPILIGLFILLLIFISVAVELENTKWATGLFSVGIFILLWHYRVDMWGWISTNPLDTAMFVVGYIVGGLIWSVIKWKSYINRSARAFKQLKDSFVKDFGAIGSNWRKWIEVLQFNKHKLNRADFYERDEPETLIKKITINPADKKNVIVSWIAYWPMSLGATLLNDPIRRFGTWIYEMFSGVYSRMSKHSVKGLGEGINKYEAKDQES